jgi:hypothetical protein
VLLIKSSVWTPGQFHHSIHGCLPSTIDRGSPSITVNDRNRSATPIIGYPPADLSHTPFQQLSGFSRNQLSFNHLI